MGLLRVIVALILIALVAITIWKLLNGPTHKKEEQELERVKLEAERLKVEEKIALEKQKNAERQSKIDNITTSSKDENQ